MATWPEVAPRVARHLRQRGVAPADVDDVVQETGVRVLTTRPGFTDAEDLYPWARTVAWRLAIDAGRRRRHLEPIETCDVPDDHTVERIVAGRLTLAAVREQLGHLSDADRQALSVAPGGRDRREAVRLAVRRHRARARLLALVEGVASVIGIAIGFLKRQRGTVLRVAAAAVPIAFVVAVEVAAPSGPPPPPTSVRAPVRTAVTVAPTAHRPAAASDSAAPSSVRRARTAASVPRPPVTLVQVGVPAPQGHGSVFVREKKPDDHLACVDTVVAGWQCVDLP